MPPKSPPTTPKRKAVSKDTASGTLASDVKPSGSNEAPSGSVKVSGAAGSSTLVDLGQLASILMQARGPIVDRLRKGIPLFSGDGTSDVSEWLYNVERLCKLEQVAPQEVVEYLLEGRASRVFRSLRVSEASNWEVVKGVLLSQYGMPKQEALRRFRARRLEVDEAVDVYLDDLQRFGARIGAGTKDEFFRVAFLEGLPSSVHKWAVMLPDAYSMEFELLVSKVRDRMSAQRAANGHKASASAAAAATATSSKKQGLACPRCSGPHRVRDCTQLRRRRAAKWKPPVVGRCYQCEKPGHYARDCPVSARVATVSHFQEEDVVRGTASSDSEMQTGE